VPQLNPHVYPCNTPVQILVVPTASPGRQRADAPLLPQASLPADLSTSLAPLQHFGYRLSHAVGDGDAKHWPNTLSARGTADRVAPLGGHGPLRSRRRRSDGDRDPNRARGDRPRHGGLLRVPRLARLVSQRQSRRDHRTRRSPAAGPRYQGRAAEGLQG
jgi:hypothetical protein